MPKQLLQDYEALPYRVALDFDQDDHVWVVRYPELPGCIGHGATKEEAIAKGEEMKSLWLETLLENGASPPEPQPEPSYSGKFVLRLPKTLHERVAQAAAREEVSLNQYLISVIADRLGANDLSNRLVEKLQHDLGQGLQIHNLVFSAKRSTLLEVMWEQQWGAFPTAATDLSILLPGSPTMKIERPPTEARHGGN